MAEVESTVRYERRQTTTPDGHVVDMQPRFCTLRLRLPGGRTVEAEAGDFYESLLMVRRQLEAQGLTVCVQGARKNAWASGMARDMGEGWRVYLLDADRQPAQADVVNLLAPAECDEVVSVDEQRTRVQQWLEHRRSRAR